MEEFHRIVWGLTSDLDKIYKDLFSHRPDARVDVVPLTTIAASIAMLTVHLTSLRADIVKVYREEQK